MPTEIVRRGLNGYFRLDPGCPEMVSTAGKTLRPGWYVQTGRPGCRGEQARALHSEYDVSQAGRLSTEVAMLERANGLGAGPRILDLDVGTLGGGCGAIVVQWAGVSLDKALFEGACVPGDPGFEGAPLGALGTPARDIENAKILFDVLVQAMNLHEGLLYHRDLRAANVCVRRCGPRPQDIRATVVDFDNCSGHDSLVRTFGNDYYATLFESLPRSQGFLVRGEPHPFDLDMAFCQALAFELSKGRRIGDCTLGELLGATPVPLVFYDAERGRVRGARASGEALAALAGRAHLPRLDLSRFDDPDQLRYVKGRIRHGGYMDALDERTIAGLSDMASFDFAKCVERLARKVHGDHVAELARQGLPAEYPDYDTMPETFRESSRAAARGYLEKIELLGYRIGRAGMLPGGLRAVGEFSGSEVEHLARSEHRRWCAEREADGWRYGPAKDVAQKAHPCLVPYDELAEPQREYDRAQVRRLIGNLADLGFCVLDERTD